MLLHTEKRKEKEISQILGNINSGEKIEDELEKERKNVSNSKQKSEERKCVCKEFIGTSLEEWVVFLS